ncbi:tRNA modification GTPase MnmE [Pseudobythopirellula maris]|uniref:tRNA modification GTPase MnmE n=1 Tax=Pseudobythopirellula maris TaxID=2527991 RepID=A0A5C5ZNR8_9BACT|nr:GTPase [Pseudobythopirellula maris]TWT88421.1 tRNA modification GTPase MnmE [Pseudobythopirellula maris]
MATVRVLTPRGRAAIAVVEVRGAGALACVDRCFFGAAGKPLGERPSNQPLFGRWLGEKGEEVVVAVRGRERVEVHCHGGDAAVGAVVASLAERGATRLEDEVEPAGVSPMAAAAWRALRSAPTERVAGVLLDQANGALDHAVEAALNRLRGGDAHGARDMLLGVLRWERLGGRLISPWRVVLAGPPNAGKSSLVNALVGYERAIVYDTPGTTRDVVAVRTALDGWPVELSDTAGLRVSSDPLEAAGIERARAALAGADLIVAVTPLAEGDAAPIESPAGVKRIDVRSKVDLADLPTPAGAIGTSSVDGRGIEALLAAITSSLVDASPEPGAAVPFLPRQAATLREACDAIEGAAIEGDVIEGDGAHRAEALLTALLATAG